MTETGPNLIVLSDPSYSLESEVEVEDLLATIQADATETGPRVPGVHRLLAGEDPLTLIGRLRYLYTIEPEKFEFTRMWLPAGVPCLGRLPEIADAVSLAGEGIPDSESWKIVVSRNGESTISIGKLIDTLSHCVLKPRTDLFNPQRLIVVTIVGEQAWVSLVDTDSILQVEPELHVVVPGTPGGRVPVE